VTTRHSRSRHFERPLIFGWFLAGFPSISAPSSADLKTAVDTAENRTGEIYSAINNPNQTFFWFSDMQKDEAIILKIYDRSAPKQPPLPVLCGLC
jgi:hypothetical protein